MSAWELPCSLNVGGGEWKIRTDYRAILDILKYFNDPEYELDERQMICLDILYEDFENMPTELWSEALQKAIEFIDMGMSDNKPSPRLMDWEQDGNLIVPAINGVLKTEIRAVESLHWWTFLGAYMEIKGGLFSEVLSIRHKKARNKKLEKWEMEFYSENKNLIDLKANKASRSEEEKRELQKLFGKRK